MQCFIKPYFLIGKVVGATDVVGILGLNGAVYEYGYWNTEISDESSVISIGSSNGVISLTNSEMRDTSVKKTYLSLIRRNLGLR